MNLLGDDVLRQFAPYVRKPSGFEWANTYYPDYAKQTWGDWLSQLWSDPANRDWLSRKPGLGR
jgi:hypothetical protein